MPKIIDDAEERIFQSVVELISQQGLENTSMKKIAECSGLAVGTLYNYFSNKEELICHVMNRSWQETFARLDEIIEEEEMEDLARAEEFASTLYDEVLSRRMVARELVRNNVIDKENIVEVKRKLRSRYEKLFAGLDLPEDNRGQKLDEERLASTITCVIITMADKYDQPQEDKDFITGLLHRLFSPGKKQKEKDNF